MQATFRSVGSGNNGAADTLHQMSLYAREAAVHPLTRQVAVSLATGTGTDAERQAARIRQWLERYVGFLRDPLPKEALHDPVWMIEQVGRFGRVEVDCDDVAMLGAALGMAIGLRARYVAIGRQQFEHVWVDLADPGRDEWYELDITRPYQDLPGEYPKLWVVEA